MPASTVEISRLLRAWGDGDRAALDQLTPLGYAELHEIAHRYMRRQPRGQTLQPTALVHEVYLRLARDGLRKYVDSKHFYCAAATAMRRILIEEVRRKGRVKHGGLLERVELTETALVSDCMPQELLALDEALDRLAAFDSDAARLVELRYFAGMSHYEAAGVLGISRRVADGLWSYARAWLLADLEREPGRTKLPGGG